MQKPSGAEYKQLQTFRSRRRTAIDRAPWLLILVAYLLGSIPFGYLVVKACGGDDIRRSGSGNIGAANVTRDCRPLRRILTLLLDAAKGYCRRLARSNITRRPERPRWMMIAAVVAVIGHVFPVWLGFRGGKGVATGLGVFLPICPKQWRPRWSSG